MMAEMLAVGIHDGKERSRRAGQVLGLDKLHRCIYMLRVRKKTGAE